MDPAIADAVEDDLGRRRYVHDEVNGDQRIELGRLRGGTRETVKDEGGAR